VTGAARRVAADWLRLREPADAAARSRELVDALLRRLPPAGGTEIHDLACGTGAMARWLSPLLPGPQRWVLRDWDANLLEAATAERPAPAADGAAVTVVAVGSDITQLEPADVAGAGLITASALLDLMTDGELRRLLGVCMTAGCPLLITLSVTGHVALSPPDPLDSRMAAAFNAHQRRTAGGGALLGPHAVAAAGQFLAAAGCEVLVRPSPWRLGPAQADLASAWFDGWAAAACEQEAELAASAAPYAARRLADARAGRLRVTVGHADLLALPPEL
jgi:hypothetical protein